MGKGGAVGVREETLRPLKYSDIRFLFPLLLHLLLRREAVWPCGASAPLTGGGQHALRGGGLYEIPWSESRLCCA